MASVAKLPMLAEGYEKLTSELKALREERPRIVDAIEEARAHGDLPGRVAFADGDRQGGRVVHRAVPVAEMKPSS